MLHRKHTLWLWLLPLVVVAACAKILTSGTEIPRISVEEVKALQDAGEDVVIVDTRVSRQYQIRHIPGALSIPERETADHLDELPPQATIVFY